MALSNIFREPQREITESAVGIAAALLVAGVWICLTAHVGATTYECRPLAKSPCWLGAVITPPLVVLIVVGVALLTHAMGDGICNAFQRRGVHLRPRERH